ncbi:CPBP family intramembrane glutamic endopeptidase [Melioribacteraceae bacterium 4301-Me]|uniref:CPBP family intramembrane glutamic endopeptidase n=1 Tax=Pyranulibacter aquaticus TaxID=3163344 RepID=UPI00359A3F24
MKKFILSKPVFSFFILSVSWSWLFFYLLTLLKIKSSHYISLSGEKSIIFYLFFLAAAIGPTLAALILSKILEGKISNLLNGLTKRTTKRIWYTIVFIPLLCVLFTRLFFSLFDSPPPINWFGWSSVLFFSFISGFVQELGWRGFAHRKFLEKSSPLITGIVVGFMWGIWSFAYLYWTAGDFFGKLFGVYFIASTFIPLLSYSVIISWIYNYTKGSLLLIILFHSSIFFFQNVFITNGKDANELVKISFIYSMITFVLAAIISLGVKTMWLKNTANSKSFYEE